MTPEQFVYWLQGYVELNHEVGRIDEKQWKMICDHLKEVFHKVTPDRSTGTQTFDPFGAQRHPPYPLGPQTDSIC